MSIVCPGSRDLTKQEVFAFRRREFVGDDYYNTVLRRYEESCAWMNNFQKGKRPPTDAEKPEFEYHKDTIRIERKFLFGG